MTKEKREEYTETTTVGKYTSVITKMRVAGIEIENYNLTKVYQDGKLIETIDNKRRLPVRIRPPRMFIPYETLVEDAFIEEKEKVILIDYKDPFWTLKKKVKRDIVCWTVLEDGIVSLFDVVTGEKVGHGCIAPSDKAIALTGYAGPEDPDDFEQWRRLANEWFTKWGYDTWNVFAPSKTAYGAYISDNTCKYHFAAAHGTPTLFSIGENEVITVSDVEGWMAGRDKMTFAFLGHCNGMRETGAGTLSNAYRKGSMQNTVTIGFSRLDSNITCQRYVFRWVKHFFIHANTGVTFKDAFDYASAVIYPCKEVVKFVGDETLTATGSTFKLHLNVEDIWIENCKVHYRIKNIGNSVGTAQMQLKINGVFKAALIESALPIGQSREGSFAHTWGYSGGRDAIQVTPDYDADALGRKTKYFMCGDVTGDGYITYNDAVRISRRAYNPNYPLEIPWAGDVTGDGKITGLDVYHIIQRVKNPNYNLFCTCGTQCEGIDLKITEIVNYGGKVRIKIKNSGTVASPSVRPGFAFRIGTTWYLKGYWLIDPIQPGATTTYTSNINWPSAGTKIQAFPDKYYSYTDCNPTNNNLTITA